MADVDYRKMSDEDLRRVVLRSIDAQLAAVEAQREIARRNAEVVPAAPPRDIMTTEEVCRYLRVSQTTLRKLIRQSGLPRRRCGSEFRYYLSDVERWSKEQSSAGVASAAVLRRLRKVERV